MWQSHCSSPTQITVLEKQDLNPLLLHGVYRFSIFLLTRGQHEFGSTYSFFHTGIKTWIPCNKWFKLFSASVQIQSQSCQWQMATFLHVEKIPFWSHLLKTDERKGRKVTKHPSKYFKVDYYTVLIEANTGPAVSEKLILSPETPVFWEVSWHLLAQPTWIFHLQIKQIKWSVLSPTGLPSVISCFSVRTESDKTLWMLLQANSIWPIVCFHGWLPD